MLKIKDDVDLKELEKFGFTQIIDLVDKEGFSYIYFMLDHKEDDQSKIKIYSNRIVSFEYKMKHSGNSFTLNLDIIYDLIQAGLVEKVEEKDEQ